MISIGTTITQGPKKYVIESKIAEGGFGVVFLAHETAAPTTKMVVKVPNENCLKDPVWSRKFEREARILANISHPNVVKIIAFWKFRDGEMALAQEYVVGATTVEKYLKQYPDMFASVTLQTLWAMVTIHDDENHEEAVVHRDISPNNLLVDQRGVVRLIDFGLAKEDPRTTEALTQAGDWFGTIGCIAPEQALSPGEVDSRADLYALGRTLGACLQNRHVVHVDPSRLQGPWGPFVQRLCEHEPKDRFQSATEALVEAASIIRATQTPISDLDRHLGAGYPAEAIDSICISQIPHLNASRPDTLEQAALFGDAVWLADPTATQAFFDRADNGAAVGLVLSGNATFDDCDPIGSAYSSMYPALDVPRKLRCFQRLVRVAVDNHRYAVMGNVRRVLANESDPSTKAALLGILDQEDPTKDIHVPGIPGRP